MYDLVVARYAENLDWIANIPGGLDVHIVNKGAKLTSKPVLARAASVVDRPNQGRESETYLSYLLQPSVDDRPTIFVQGDPFEHSPDFLPLLGTSQNWADVQPLSWQWRRRRDIPPEIILQRERSDFIGGYRVRAERFALGTWGPLGFRDPGTEWLVDEYIRLHGLPAGSNIAAHFLRSCKMNELAAEAETHAVGRFAYGAAFAVRSVTVRHRFEEGLRLMRAASLGHEVYGYMIERLWLHIFGEPFLLPVSLASNVEQREPMTTFKPPDTRSTSRRTLDRVARRMRRLAAR